MSVLLQPLLLATLVAPPGEAPPDEPRSEAAMRYERGQAAFIAADFAECITQLEAALEAGIREAPRDVQTLEIRLSLAQCRSKLGRVEEDRAELRRAAVLLAAIIDDAAELGYTADDVAFAKAELAEVDRLLVELTAPPCPAVPPPVVVRDETAAERVRQRRRRAKGGALVGSGALLVVVGGGLIGYGAAVLPQARRFGVEDQRPWRAYAAIGLGFGVASTLVGIGGIVWGAITLRERAPKRVALSRDGIAISF
jgi:hypothetical protein